MFDRAFSFDKPDCEKLGIRFLPLFYLRDYEKSAGRSLITATTCCSSVRFTATGTGCYVA